MYKLSSYSNEAESRCGFLLKLQHKDSCPSHESHFCALSRASSSVFTGKPPKHCLEEGCLTVVRYSLSHVTHSRKPLSKNLECPLRKKKLPNSKLLVTLADLPMFEPNHMTCADPAVYKRYCKDIKNFYYWR